MEPYEFYSKDGVYASRFLDIVGDGSGSIDMNINGAAGIPFMVTADTGEVLLVERLLVHLTDAGNLDAGYYGNSVVLTNGITVSILRADASEEVLTLGKPIKTNVDWAAFCYDVDELGFGLGDNCLSVRWTFNKDGAPIKLNPGDSLVMTINDDLSGLTGHTARAGMISSRR